MAQFWSRNLTYIIIVGLGLGAGIGFFLGPQAHVFGEIGRLVIQLIKAIATPMIFLAIVHSLLTTNVTGRDFFRLLSIAATNAMIAIIIGLGLSNYFKPGEHLSFATQQAAEFKPPNDSLDLVRILSSHIPSSIIQPFLENLVLQVVILALGLGFALRAVRTKHPKSLLHIEQAFSALFDAVEILLHWITLLIPFAVFGAVAKSVGQYGFEPLTGLIYFVLVVLLGFFVHVFFTYQAWIALYAGLSLREFWKRAIDPLFYAFGCNSSLATLPLTLKALGLLHVPKSASTLAACVGTNLNNDGIVLYEAMAVLAVAQAQGMDLSFSLQIVAAFYCMITALGVAGIPEAGIIALSLVLTSLNVSSDTLGLLLTVDWILARGRSVVNVLSDMVGSIALAQMQKSTK